MGGGGGGHFHIRLVGNVPTFSVSIFSKISKTGSKILVNVPHQGSQKLTIFQNRSNKS